jgi:hypothetical protein
MHSDALLPWLKWCLKLAVSGGLIWLVVDRAGAETIGERFGRADLGLLAVLVPIVATFLVAGAARWWFVCRAIGTPLAFPAAARIFSIGYFFNQTLPSTLGGDAYRAWASRSEGLSIGQAVRSVVGDRLVGLVALLATVGAGLPELVRRADTPVVAPVLAACVVGGLAATVLLAALPPRLLERWRWLHFLAVVARDLRSLARRPAGAIPALLLSLVVLALLATTVHVVAAAFGVPLALADALVLVPPVILVTVLPISLGGWGVRELGMGVTLGWAGIASGDAVAVSIATGLVLLATGLPGGILWLAGRARRAAAPPPAGGS